MTDDVRARKLNEGNALHAPEDAHRILETGLLALLEILLCEVTCDDDLRAEADTGEEHLHLCRCRILCLIEDDVGIVQRTAAHIGERCDLDEPLFRVRLVLLGAHDAVERVVDRAHVRIDLRLKIPWQEAELLSGLDRRTGQDDALHFLLTKGRDGHRHTEVGLTGTRRTDAEGDHVLADRIHVVLLAEGLRLHRLAQCGAREDILIDLHHVAAPALLGEAEGDRIIYVLLGQGIATLAELEEILQNSPRLFGIPLLTDDLQNTVPIDDGDMKAPLDFLQIAVEKPENVLLVLHRDIKNCFYACQLLPPRRPSTVFRGIYHTARPQRADGSGPTLAR